MDGDADDGNGHDIYLFEWKVEGHASLPLSFYQNVNKKEEMLSKYIFH